MTDVLSGLYRIVMEADKKASKEDTDKDPDAKDTDKDKKPDPDDPEAGGPVDKATDYSIDDEEVEGGEKKDDSKGTEYGDGLKGDEPEPPDPEGDGSGGKDPVSPEDPPEDNPEDDPDQNGDKTPGEGVDAEEGEGTDYSSLDEPPDNSPVDENPGEDSPNPDSEDDNTEGDEETEGEEPDDKIKQYYLQVDFDRLQAFITNSIEKLTDVRRDSFIEKEVDAQCVSNYEQLLQGIKDYILLKFDKNDYVTNRFNYSKFATAAKLNLELLNKINNSNNSGKQ